MLQFLSGGDQFVLCKFLNIGYPSKQYSFQIGCMMRYISFFSLTSCLIFPTFGFAGEATTHSLQKWSPQFEIEGKASNSGRRAVIPKIMVPIHQNENAMLFTDIRTRQENGSSDEYNLGLGYRQIIDRSVILGGFVQFDSLRSESHNTYKQATFGFEALSENFDARLNFYRPEGDVNNVGATSVAFGSDSQILISGNQERALPGYDFEIGAKLPVDFAEIRAYAGYYNFDDHNIDRISGPRGRLELTLNNQHLDFLPVDGMEVSFGFEASDDDVRGEQRYGLFEIKIPFGPNASQNKSLYGIDRRMHEFIERDIDVVTNEALKTEAATVNGRAAHIIDANENIDDYVGSGYENTTLILDGTAGVFNSVGGTVNVANNQSVIGGATPLTFVGVETGRQVRASFGSAATVNDSFLVGDGATLQNFTIAGEVDISNTNDITISGMTINSAGDGVVYDNFAYVENANIQILDTDFNVDGTAINLDFNNTMLEGVLTFENLSIQADQAIFVGGPGTGIGTINISSVNVTASDQDAIVINKSGMFNLNINNTSTVSTFGVGLNLGSTQVVTANGSGNNFTGNVAACDISSTFFGTDNLTAAACP